MKNPLKYFSEVADPRLERNREHRLDEILLIAIAAVLSGAERWNDIAEFGREKRPRLETFLTLPGGIPSHDTFHRVFAAIDPDEFEAGFVAWVSSLADLTAGGVVAIDGKTLRGTWEAGSKSLVHMVSAWSEAHHLVLGQRKVDDKADDKSNEIKVIPKLLEALELAGTVVTIDAMGCRREIATKIVEKKADYVLALKGNQGLLAEQVRDSFALLPAASVWTEVDCGHGRVEHRNCSVIGNPSLIEKAAAWNSFACLVKIDAERFHKATGKTERETHSYISSLRQNAARMNSVIRQHWGIESKHASGGRARTIGRGLDLVPRLRSQRVDYSCPSDNLTATHSHQILEESRAGSGVNARASDRTGNARSGEKLWLRLSVSTLEPPIAAWP